jgi:cell division protein FtsB
MLFFDQRDMFNTLDQKKKLKELEVKKAYYVQEIEKAQQALSDLKNNPAALEKFARERYFMKKDGEDIYIVDPQAETSK